MYDQNTTKYQLQAALTAGEGGLPDEALSIGTCGKDQPLSHPGD